MLKLAKIVKSNSHVDYVGRVIDRLDADAPPEASDYGFAQFVALPLSDEAEVVGVIYNTQLANPEYGNFGPRLSSSSELAVLSPDYLNEVGVLVGVLLLGWRDGATNHHGVPRRVIPVGRTFTGSTLTPPNNSTPPLTVLCSCVTTSQIIAHAGAFAVPLIEAIIEQLEPACAPADRQRLCVLKKSLVWQRTLGSVRRTHTDSATRKFRTMKLHLRTAMTALLITLIAASVATAQRPRSISDPADPTTSSQSTAPAPPPAPATVKAKYEGGVIGYKKSDGTITFDDANSRLVFRDQKQKEVFAIPYQVVMLAYADTQARRPTAATVAGFASPALRRKPRRVVHQEKISLSRPQLF